MSSSEPESPGAVSGSSSRADFTREENLLRERANARLLKLLEDPDAEVPAGQLMAFVAKVGFRVEAEKPEQAQIQTQNILAILPGLPAERQDQIIAGFEKAISEARKARKELPNGE